MDDEEEDFEIPADDDILDGIADEDEEEDDEDPLTMDGFHEEGDEPELDF